MANNSFVAQMARVYLAPVGTSAPAGPVAEMPTGWKDVGLFTPDSLKWSTDPKFEEMRSHQSNYATRRWQTEDAATVEVDLQEWSGDNFKAVFGGGTVTKVEVTGPPAFTYYRFAPPAIGARTSVSVCIELVDGTRHLRRIVPVAEQIEGVEQGFDKSKESTLPLRLSVIGSDVGDPWYDFNDIASFAPPATP
ncbi:hypothetical protein [Actinomadura yumaensis]|uniref:Phage tail protein n=1 Tax=Actinomadura yumaensis TaxID=111807 RepID=A0ABW2CR40_9ACTN